MRVVRRHRQGSPSSPVRCAGMACGDVNRANFRDMLVTPTSNPRISMRFFSLLLALLLPVSAAHAVHVSLPTSNDNLLGIRLDDFYQRTARSGDSAWQGGMYGLVRNARTIRGEEIYTRFHEGIDIKPLYRDERGEPLDSVRSISGGIVVYVNGRAGHSNYGKYVVVEHIWDGSLYYSLYAHLNEVWVDSGAVIDGGDLLGRLGYTGAGINRARAHLHLEICMLYNSAFQIWYEEEHTPRDSNFHGIFNGRNLAGFDPARFLSYMIEHPRRSVPDFLADEDLLYTIQLPRNLSGYLDLIDRYDWLLTREPEKSDRSWRISFISGGVPIRVEPIEEETEKTIVCYVAERQTPVVYASKRALKRKGDDCSLSPAGERIVDLLNEERPPEP